MSISRVLCALSNVLTVIFLFSCQPPASRNVIGQYKDGDNGDRDGSAALNQEQNAP